MKVMVLGGTGFIGSHLVERLANNGFDVVVPARKESKRKSLPTGSVQVVEADLLRPGSLDGLMEGVDTVFHLAAIRGSGWSLGDEEVFRVNVGITRNLMEAAVSQSVKRCIYMSSVSVYGHPSNVLVSEEYPCSPVTRYGQTKYESEKLVEEFHRKDKLLSTIIRPVITYGPGDTWGMVAKLISLINLNRYLTIGNGENRVHLIYINDLIDGLMLILNNHAARGRTYIFAGEEPITINRLAGIISVALGKRVINLHIPILFARLAAHFMEFSYRLLAIHNEPLVTLDKIDIMCRDRAFDFKRAKEDLRFAPKVGYEEGIERTVAWLKAAELF
jgi:nucleoside-diphosphate-sugar epimerase